MSETALHPTPRWGAIAHEQFRSVGLATRREWLLFALGLAVLTVLLIASYQRALAEGHQFRFNFLPNVAVPLMYLGVIAPLSVWRGLAPSHRGYLWALPAERGAHTLLRNFHGWLWFMALVAVYLLWALVIAWATGGDIGVERERVLLANLPRAGNPSVESVRAVLADAANWRELRWTVPAWMWAIPFVGATAMYLLGSALVLASDYPWRWLAGIVVGFLVLRAVSDAADLNGITGALNSVVAGRWGLGTLFGGTDRVQQVFTNDAGETVLRAVKQPALGRWLATAALWLGLGMVGTLAAALRHQER